MSKGASHTLREARSTHLSGIGLRLLAAFLITAMSAAIHAVADRLPVGQIMFWRALLALPPILIYMLWRNESLRTAHPRLHITRGALGAISMALSFLSLAYLPVANAQALAYLAPVLALPLAALLLGERLTLTVILAAALGFGGVLAMLWQALALPGDGAAIGVAAGLAYAFTMAFVRVHTKRMTVTEGSSTIAFYFAIVAAASGLVTLPFGWQPLSLTSFTWLTLAGLLGGVGHIISNEATARAPVSTLAPFDFTGLIWALGFDLILFATLPSGLGWLGIALITGAALLITFRPPKQGG
ncbi:DMT family transporter [Pontivivens insulae]|uniref:Riboflavin transporter n=1 Tax=Pontivivens insulae TaxID=1639689 RepID=A0A2R8AD00_9RHOB|nr:DMT family transporter [Pontivivens insulae]RED13876.1 EamA domain-containing membrane protein RarD [Pontivivens insulae]SPF29950.1 Riboflavin transporter [Pontivivens insulae]